MTIYFVDLEGSREKVKKTLNDARAAERIKVPFNNGLSLDYSDKVNCWFYRHEGSKPQLTEPDWFVEVGLAVSSISHLYDFLPYDPAHCSPYIGEYYDGGNGCSATVECRVASGTPVISIEIKAPPELFEEYLSKIRSRQLRPSRWMQPPVGEGGDQLGFAGPMKDIHRPGTSFTHKNRSNERFYNIWWG